MATAELTCMILPPQYLLILKQTFLLVPSSATLRTNCVSAERGVVVCPGGVASGQVKGLQDLSTPNGRITIEN